MGATMFASPRVDSRVFPGDRSLRFLTKTLWNGGILRQELESPDCDGTESEEIFCVWPRHKNLPSQGGRSLALSSHGRRSESGTVRLATVGWERDPPLMSTDLALRDSVRASPSGSVCCQAYGGGGRRRLLVDGCEPGALDRRVLLGSPLGRLA